MTDWEANSSGVKITAQNRNFYAKKLVLAVGGWLEKSVAGLHVKVQPVAVPVYFWDIKSNYNGFFELDKRSPNLIISDVWKDEEVKILKINSF